MNVFSFACRDVREMKHVVRHFRMLASLPAIHTYRCRRTLTSNFIYLLLKMEKLIERSCGKDSSLGFMIPCNNFTCEEPAGELHLHLPFTAVIMFLLSVTPLLRTFHSTPNSSSLRRTSHHTTRSPPTAGILSR